ncbi:alpha/beta fold hydrolase [Roseateles sp.]|uniref:alpha/beta fold hydrolase n=1 Tax=Roseateles sp. TaxID=1971397 RepID=UPI0025E25F7A|nr:alpha/beta hydrolase [Roseateles sp.]MBV8036510.1 hypothetical protein [Roseateles sp.]
MTTLVLLPGMDGTGMDGTGMLFDPLMEALSGLIPLEVVKYPSATPAGYAEYERFAEASLPAKGPLVLLGESFSGPIAISLAAKHPMRIAGLVLCCAFAPMATSNSPTCGHVNSPRQDEQDYESAGTIVSLAAASRSR